MPDQTVEPQAIATRYTVSLFPLDDDNCLPYALFVQHSRRGWGITDGMGWVEGCGDHIGYWTLDHYEALLFDDLNNALALAWTLAPFRTAKGVNAIEAYRRAYPDAARQATGQTDAAHVCTNCDGIDPGTCLTNPDRPAARQPTGVPCGVCGTPWTNTHGYSGDCQATGQDDTKPAPCGAPSLPISSGEVVRCVLFTGHTGQCQSATAYPWVSWPNPSNGVWNPTAQPDPTTADDPTPLRWGLDDVLHGDDDTITVCLSGPDRAPYWLDLDPEQAAALRDALTPDDPAVGQPAEAQGADRAALRERVRLAVAQWHLDDSGSGRTVHDLDDAEFGTLADAVLTVPAEAQGADRAADITWTVEDER